jgi:hypothetical protein
MDCEGKLEANQQLNSCAVCGVLVVGLRVDTTRGEDDVEPGYCDLVRRQAKGDGRKLQTRSVASRRAGLVFILVSTQPASGPGRYEQPT